MDFMDAMTHYLRACRLRDSAREIGSEGLMELADDIAVVFYAATLQAEA